MEEEAEKLMAENISKNFIDYEEYPQSAELCVSSSVVVAWCVYVCEHRVGKANRDRAENCLKKGSGAILWLRLIIVSSWKIEPLRQYDCTFVQCTYA